VALQVFDVLTDVCIVLQPVLPQSPCTEFRGNQGVICVADDSGDIWQLFGLLGWASPHQVGNVFPWFESFTGGKVLSLICLFRRCCISDEVGGEVLSLVRLIGL
jgi:hypothetical protein